MSSWGSQSDRERVLEATDLIQLIGEHVALRPKGREHVGLCPFHDDSRPSLHVVTHKGNAFYKCFACGAAGSAFDFVMAYHKKDFAEALRFLADRAGITLTPRAQASARGSGVSRADIRQANAIALDFFRAVLAAEGTGAPYRKLLEERGISVETIEAFKLGAAPDAWDSLLKRIGNRGMGREAFLAAGLLKRKEGEDRCYDAFRNRLIFPICDETGAPIAFGGRKVAADDEPKYLNSAESAVFDKSATLFGLHLAKRAIIDAGQAIVTEGYTDVIGCHQAGIANVVGTLGTALTPRHAQYLSRLCDTVVLVFDGDEAGQRAADRALAVFFQAPVDVKICTLPPGLDPDDLLRLPDGRSRLLEHVGAAEDALVFRINRFQREFEAIESISGRQKHAERFLQELAALQFGSLQGIRKRHAIALLSSRLGLTIGEIETMLARYRPRRAPAQGASSAPAAPGDEAVQPPAASEIAHEIWERPAGTTRARRLAERDLLSILIHEPSLGLEPVLLSDGTVHPRPLAPGDFADPITRRIADFVLARLGAGETFNMQSLLEACPEPAVRSEAGDLYFAGGRICSDEPDGPPAALARAVETLSNCVKREKYQRSVSTCTPEALDHEEQIRAVQEAIERRREQRDLSDAIAHNV
ncbi:MAG: DNA primase [Phycisphaerales bacterium]|nr:MAG: DNA primase [Phycisphaerales bacterium]